MIGDKIMKKKVILSVVVVVLVVMVAMMATACNTTPDKLKEKLEGKGYDVQVHSDEEIITMIDSIEDPFYQHVFFNYVDETPSDEESAKPTVLYKDNVEQVFVVYAKEDSTKPVLFVFWYSDKNSAKNAQSQATTNLRENIISGDALSSDEIASGATEPFKNKGIVRKGNAVVIGDASLIKSL